MCCRSQEAWSKRKRSGGGDVGKLAGRGSGEANRGTSERRSARVQGVDGAQRGVATDVASVGGSGSTGEGIREARGSIRGRQASDCGGTQHAAAGMEAEA